uniref:Macrophage mannose receptor 1-like n=1 Tax=Geotrypetes seraphini TaxID=260995 RepID=A0A6P8NSJ4_GEOSA|nr:macrophage mannose receptor 1-like [Geotrypetes seraphini]
MAWQSMYGNIDSTDQVQAQKELLRQKHLSTESDIYLEEESIYEPIQSTETTERRYSIKKPPFSPAQTPRSECRLLVLVSGILAASLLLFLAVLTVGFVKFSSPFLIYNEDHNRCVAVEHPDAVKAMPCDPHNSTQQFQWLSKGRLLHVALKLCLGVLDKSSRQALQLHPCKAGSDLQQWECQDDKLFAMKGSKLYFNYGNSKRGVAMLYYGTGPWSRWVIYGSRDDLCSWSCDVCLPCLKGWSFYQGHCYYFSWFSAIWEDANKSCVSQESSLLIIDSQEEQIYIQDKVATKAFWIGLTLGEEWKWVDGSSVSPHARSWGPGQPDNSRDEECASMSHTGEWHDCVCEEKLPWICEKIA